MIYASSGYADNLSCNRDMDQIKGIMISELEIMKSDTAEKLINWYNKKNYAQNFKKIILEKHGVIEVLGIK